MLFTRRRYPACWGSCSREKSLLERLRKVLWTRLLVRWKSSRVKLPGLCPAYFIFSSVVFIKFFESPDMCLSSGQVQPYGFHWLATRQACSFTGLTFQDKSFPLRGKFVLRDVFRRRKQKYSWTKVGTTSFLLSRKRLSTSLAKLTNLLSQVPMSFKINQLLIVLWWAF